MKRFSILKPLILFTINGYLPIIVIGFPSFSFSNENYFWNFGGLAGLDVITNKSMGIFFADVEGGFIFYLLFYRVTDF